MKLCDYTKFTWNVIPEQELTQETAGRHKILLLPEVYHVNANLKRLLEHYVENGGVILSAGETGLYGTDGYYLPNYALADLYGCDYAERIDRYSASAWGGYLKLAEGIDWKRLPETYPPVSETFHRIKNHGGKPLAWFVEPASEVTDEIWVNWWCPPPAHPTGDIAILENTFGKGKVIFAAFDLFRMENKGFNLTRELFRSLVERHLRYPALKLETENRQTLGFVGYERAAQHEIIVHEISHLPELTRGDAPEIAGGILTVNEGFGTIQKAEWVYPAFQELPITGTGSGSITVKLPPIKIHNIFRMKYS